MSEMVERVAKIIADNPVNWLDYVDKARDAIAGMREPSVVMRLVGGYTQKHGKTEDDRYAYNIWQTMIDAALSD